MALAAPNAANNQNIDASEYPALKSPNPSAAPSAATTPPDTNIPAAHTVSAEIQFIAVTRSAARRPRM